jgi:DNA-binding FadR family transcriptional regulator
VAECLPEVHFGGDDRAALVAQLFELRHVIEPAIVEMAARRATEVQRVEIIEIASRSATTLDEFRVIDREFHAALARSCGNASLKEVHSKAMSTLFGSGELAAVLDATLSAADIAELIETSAAAHRSIADAVAKCHPRKAMAAAVTHLDDVERRMAGHRL